MTYKKVILIGAGNVATHLGIGLQKIGYNITQVYSRGEESASLLAKLLHTDYTIDLEEISDQADFYIFSVKDAALEEVIKNMPYNKGVWMHTSGSTPINIFNNKAERFGVLYPLQTFSKEKKIEWQNIPLFIEGSDQDSNKSISELANNLSESVYSLSSEDRKYIHLSAVFACNFTNYMYNIASDIVEKTNIPFDILLPLIDETCQKVHELHPYEAQTGPAIRYDKNIIKKHIDLLEKPELKEIYKLLSEGIHKRHQ